MIHRVSIRDDQVVAVAKPALQGKYSSADCLVRPERIWGLLKRAGVARRFPDREREPPL